MTEHAPDLFGFKPRQGDLFAGEPARNDGVYTPNPAEIRARLHKLLARAKAANPGRLGASGTRGCSRPFFRKWRIGCLATKRSSCGWSLGLNWSG